MTQAKELFDLGCQKIIQKKYIDAISILSRAHSLEHNDLDTKEMLSSAYTLLGIDQANSYAPSEAKSDTPTTMAPFQEAVGNLRKAIEIDPNNVSAKKNLSILIAGWGWSIAVNFPYHCYENAIVQLKEAIALDPENTHAKRVLSTVEYMQLASNKNCEQNYEEAISNFKKALGIAPDNKEVKSDLSAVIYTEIAKSQVNLGRCDEALSTVRKALELDPECASANENLPVILGNVGAERYKAKNYEEAIIFFAEAFEIDHESFRVRNNLSSAYIMLGQKQFEENQREEAIASLTKALEIDPGNYVAQKVLSAVWTKVGAEHMEQGQREEAIYDFKKAIEFYSMNERAKDSLKALVIEEEASSAAVDGMSCAETSSLYSKIKQSILEPLQKFKAKGKISGKADVTIKIKTDDISHEDITRYCVDELHLFEVDIEFYTHNCSITISPEALAILGIVESS